MTRGDQRSTAGRARFWLLAGAALLALVGGVVRELREPLPPASQAPAAGEFARPEPPPPAAAAPFPAPEAAPAPAPPSRREAVRALLEESLTEHYPDRKLSSDELDAAADALLRVRAARLEIQALPRTPENAERLHELEEAMGRAFEDFEYLVDVDPVTFTEKASGELDEEDADEEPQ